MKASERRARECYRAALEIVLRCVKTESNVERMAELFEIKAFPCVAQLRSAEQFLGRLLDWNDIVEIASSCQSICADLLDGRTLAQLQAELEQCERDGVKA